MIFDKSGFLISFLPWRKRWSFARNRLKIRSRSRCFIAPHYKITRSKQNYYDYYDCYNYFTHNFKI
jgi:hypothetical protein